MLRAKRPAEATSATERATCPTTRTARARRPRTFPAPPPSRIAPKRSVRAACTAGARPARIADTAVMATVNARMRPSRRNARSWIKALSDVMRSRADPDARATRTLTKAPAAASTQLSAKNSRSNLPLLAPMASRTAVSLPRSVARARRMFATLRHAMSSTTAAVIIRRTAGLPALSRHEEAPVAPGSSSSVLARNLARKPGDAVVRVFSSSAMIALEDDIGFGPRLGCGQPGLDPGHDREEMGSPAADLVPRGARLGLHHRGQIQIRRASDFEASEPLGADPDNGHRRGIDLDLAPDHIGLTAESPLPEGVAEDHDGVPTRSRVVRRPQEPPRRRVQAEGRKVGARDQVASHGFHLAVDAGLEGERLVCQRHRRTPKRRRAGR